MICHSQDNTLAASDGVKGTEVWTLFSVQSSGLSCFIVFDVGMLDQQVGRLVQRNICLQLRKLFMLNRSSVGGLPTYVGTSILKYCGL